MPWIIIHKTVNQSKEIALIWPKGKWADESDSVVLLTFLITGNRYRLLSVICGVDYYGYLFYRHDNMWLNVIEFL